METTERPHQAKLMSHFDELPRRDRNHEIEDRAIAAFHTRLTESGAFILQAPDRKDYGTDCQIEVMADGQATNARVHVQLKGTEAALNADGSLSVEVRRTNLNYLLMQPYSVYVAYHAPTGSLRIRTAESVAHQYEHGGTNWTDQRSLTVSFVEELTVERLGRLADLAGSGAKSSRDRRVDQVGVGATGLSSYVLKSPPDVHVPEEPALARKLLVQLYEKNADEAISAAFAKFAAVLGAGSAEIGICYMSEINLGMDGMSRHPERIEEAISFFRTRLTDGCPQVGDLHYTIGNAFHALRHEQEAKRAFEAALTDPALAASPELAAQVHKNLGSSYALLGDHEQAVDHYREALRLNPDLAEAHNAWATTMSAWAITRTPCVISTKSSSRIKSRVEPLRSPAGAPMSFSTLATAAQRFAKSMGWWLRLTASLGFGPGVAVWSLASGARVWTTPAKPRPSGNAM
jgi:hypothetical protein